MSERCKVLFEDFIVAFMVKVYQKVTLAISSGMCLGVYDYSSL